MIPSFRHYAKVLVHGSLARSRRVLHARRESIPSLTVFTYHSFCATQPADGLSSILIERFEQELEWLRATHQLVSLSEGLQKLDSAPNKRAPMAAITIDDGFADNYHVAWPVLLRQDIPATIFVATDFIDTGRLPWPTRLWDIVQAMQRRKPAITARRHSGTATAIYRQLQTELCCKDAAVRCAEMDRLATVHDLHDLPARPALSWNQIREMAATGTTFGSHTASHGYLPSLAKNECIRELVQSKHRIEQELQQECRYFAYPNGDWSDATANLVCEAGYRAALTQDFGSNTVHHNPCLLNRVEVPSHDPLASFKYRALRATTMVTVSTTRTIAGSK